MADAPTDSEDAALERDVQERLRGRRFMALSLMLVATLFCGLVIGVMVATRLGEGPAPPDLAALEAKREALAAAPTDQATLESIRRGDAQMRAVYLANRRRLAWGALLLLAGVVVLVACARWYAVLDPRRPGPSDPVERGDPDRWLGLRRRSLVGFAAGAAVLAAAIVVVAISGGLDYPRATVPAPGPAAGAVSVVEEDSPFKENWPRFRGPTGTGIVEGGDWPREWDAEAGTNILWTTPVPMPGRSSPVLWGNRIFLTGADENQREIMCFERSSGRLLWRAPIRTQRPDGTDEDDELSVFDDTGYAAPTPVTDGERVYALFATADLAAVDFDGRVVWAHNLGKPENAYGMASSPIFHDGKLIVEFDRGEAYEELSAIMALEPTTGKEIWRTDRPVRQSWSTPLVIDTEEGVEIITCADPWVISYDPDLGAELWRARGLSGDVAPSPIHDGNLVYVMTEYSAAMAIRTGGVGDVTDTDVVWINDESSLSDASSPVCDGSLLLQVNSGGTLTCHKAATGEVVWEHDLGETVWASPTLVGKLVYLPAMEGKTYIIELADEYREVSSGTVDGTVYATPAFADSRIYMRTDTSLICIGKAQ